MLMAGVGRFLKAKIQNNGSSPMGENLHLELTVLTFRLSSATLEEKRSLPRSDAAGRKGGLRERGGGAGDLKGRGGAPLGCWPSLGQQVQLMPGRQLPIWALGAPSQLWGSLRGLSIHSLLALSKHSLLA